jgi:probable HAF family extracellular repeat protein
MTDLGPVSPAMGYISLGINDAGTVTGTSSEGAFVYSNGTMTDLGPGPLGGATYACGINDAGQVVGESYNSAGTEAHAFVCNGGAVQDLNNLIAPGCGWSLIRADAVNSAGQIVGDGVGPGGQSTAFLLTPALPGDVNLDGRVDVNDLTIVLTHFGKSGCAWSQGCVDGDPAGAVDVNDLTIVLANFRTSAGAPAAGAAAVPEPSCLVLAGACAAGMAAFAWRLTADVGVYRPHAGAAIL